MGRFRIVLFVQTQLVAPEKGKDKAYRQKNATVSDWHIPAGNTLCAYVHRGSTLRAEERGRTLKRERRPQEIHTLQEQELQYGATVDVAAEICSPTK